MTTVVETSFQPGTIVLVGSERHEVVERQLGVRAHDSLEDGEIPTRYLGTADFPINSDIYEAIYADDITSVESEALLAPVFSPLLKSVFGQIEPQPWNLAIANLALEYDREITFRYAKAEGAIIEQRSVTPHLVYETSDNEWVVVGDDPDRKDIRAFRLDRIVGELGVNPA